MKKKYLLCLVVCFLFALCLQANAAASGSQAVDAAAGTQALGASNSQASQASQAMIDSVGTQQLGDAGFMVYPANPNGVAMDVLYYEVKPGAVINDEVTVSNYGKKDRNFFLYAVDYVKEKGQGTQEKIVAAQFSDPKLVVGKWTTVEQQEFFLKAGEKKKVKIKIVIPADAKLDTYRAGIALENRNPSTNHPTITIATRLIQDVKILVTDSPKRVPTLTEYVAKTNSEILTRREDMEKKSGPTWYFYFSIAIFASGACYYLISKMVEKGKKKEDGENKPAEHKHGGGESPKGPHGHEHKK